MDDRPTLRIDVPDGLPKATGQLIRIEHPQLELLTGCCVVTDEADRVLQWVVDPHAPNVSLERTDVGYRAVVRSLDEVTESLGLLRGLDGRATATVSTGRPDAIDRLDAELRDNFAGAHLGKIHWDEVRAAHEADVLASEDVLPALQRWLAELGDVHTAARPTSGAIAAPYVVAVDGDGARLLRVRPGTAAHDAGVRAGWSLVTAEATDWWGRSGGPAHMRALIAGRRLMTGTPGTARHFVARSPDGAVVEWDESYELTPAGLDIRARGAALIVAIGGWSAEVRDALDALLAEEAGRDSLVLDLRGNAGGNLVAALSARDRFVRASTVCGTIRYTDGHGVLGAASPIVAEPGGPSWGGRLVVVTDGLTASASEDFLLGLRGLPHVRVIGTATTGASGRAITRRLLDGVDVTISTALTYDRDGRCVEGSGIPVDDPVDPFDDEAVEAVIDRLVR